MRVSGSSGFSTRGRKKGGPCVTLPRWLHYSVAHDRDLGEFMRRAISAFWVSSDRRRSSNCLGTAGWTIHALLTGPSFGSHGVSHPAATSGDTRRFRSKRPNPRKPATLAVMSDATIRCLLLVSIQLASLRKWSPLGDAAETVPIEFHRV